MKILVTGAAGFIGYFFCKKLIEHNYEVVGLDNINNYYDPIIKFGRLNELGIIQSGIHGGEAISSNIYNNFKFIKEDLENKEFLDKLFEKEKFDVVINLAAQAGVRYSITDPDAYISSNVVGFYNILESVRKHPVKQLIYASSSSVYGNSDKVPFSTQDKTDSPISLYAASKKTNELMAHTYSHLYKIPAVGLRFFTVYGPWGRPDMAYFSFIDNILSGTPIRVFNKGNLSRDFTYIDDIIDGIYSVFVEINRQQGGSNYLASHRVFNIGNSKPVKLMDFIKTIEDELKLVARKQFVEMQQGDVERTWADISEIQYFCGYSPKTNLPFGIKEFVKWYKAFYKL